MASIHYKFFSRFELLHQPNVEERLDQRWATIFQLLLPGGFSIPKHPPLQNLAWTKFFARCLVHCSFEPSAKPEKTLLVGTCPFQSLCDFCIKEMNGDQLLDRVFWDITRHNPEHSSHIALFVRQQSLSPIPLEWTIFRSWV